MSWLKAVWGRRRATVRESELQLGLLGPSLQPPKSQLTVVQGITGDEVKTSSGRRQKLSA